MHEKTLPKFVSKSNSFRILVFVRKATMKKFSSIVLKNTTKNNLCRFSKFSGQVFLKSPGTNYKI